MKIKAHPTVYGGVHFRSRLEATWAAFFYLTGIKWSYEPIDFEGWSPDFVLWVSAPIYVEVKPAPMQRDARMDLLKLDHSFPGFEKAVSHCGSVNVLLLGMQPNEEAGYFGPGVLLDRADGGSWSTLMDDIRVENAAALWGEAQKLTQWSPK